MQTFLPFESFELSAACLDNKRLGKQRVEAYQILRAITGESKGWINHPATKMWSGYSYCLKLYINACIREWVKRGFKNTMSEYIIEWEDLSESDIPYWFCNIKFHRQHQLMLLKKDLNHYSQYFYASKEEIDAADYIWPEKRRI